MHAPGFPLIHGLEFEAMDQARLRRDPGYDGVFFIAVRTTGIYCRPVCRVRQPLIRNISFFPSAAAAEKAGYRSCLKCRPESAPFCPAWNGTRSTVERALKLIDSGGLDGGATVAALAERCGVGARHLSRLFKQHLGASPGEVAQSRRIQGALQLITGGQLPMTKIALQSGFGSLRCFNEIFAARYGRPPTALRRQRIPAHLTIPIPTL